jgi:hypothetical protein
VVVASVQVEVPPGPAAVPAAVGDPSLVVVLAAERVDEVTSHAEADGQGAAALDSRAAVAPAQVGLRRVNFRTSWIFPPHGQVWALQAHWPRAAPRLRS